MQMVNKHMKRYTTSLTVSEMQIKTTMKYHLKPVKMTIFKKNTNNKCWQGHREKGTLVRCCWECKLVQPLWKTVQRFLKKLKIELPYDPAILLLVIYLKKSTNLKRYMHPNAHGSLIYNCQGMVVSTNRWIYIHTHTHKHTHTHTHTHTGILLGPKKEGNYAICSNLDGLEGQYTKWNK